MSGAGHHNFLKTNFRKMTVAQAFIYNINIVKWSSINCIYEYENLP